MKTKYNYMNIVKIEKKNINKNIKYFIIIGLKYYYYKFTKLILSNMLIYY